MDMEKKYLIVNRGSSSEKYAVYTKEKRLAYLYIERSDSGSEYTGNLYIDDKKETLSVSKKDFKDSLDYCLKIFITKEIILSKEDIVGIGIRIVAPGLFLQNHKIIDSDFEKELKRVMGDSPLHIKPAYNMILELQKKFKKVPIVGVSDSAFHRTLPPKAKYYAIPFEDTKKYQIQKYGYHGISMEAVVEKIKKENGSLPEKLIICHIGSGASVTAVKNGQSIENSMGFTVLEGLVMATRGGDIDPGVISFLTDNLKLKGDSLREYLNKKSGLLGISGKSSDVRDLIKLEKEGDVQAKLALDMYVYRLQKYIGAYFVALGGLDMLVFTATVGERSFIIRERVCQALEVLGLKINKEINNQSEGIDADISAVDSKVKILVRKTDEVEQIAKDTIFTLGF
jgi:acetate kinase